MSLDEVIERIAATTVPVAVNLHLMRRGKYAWQTDEDGKRIELMHVPPDADQKMRDQYQGIWLLAPDGRVLAIYGSGDAGLHWDPKINEPLVKDFLARVDGAVKEVGQAAPRKVEPVNTMPYRGVGVQPDGSVTLAAYINSRLLDSFTFDKSEWPAFAPARAEAGAEWTLPAAARKFARIMSPIGDLGHLPPGPDDVTDVALTAKVVAIREGIAEIEYTGRIAATRRREDTAVSEAAMTVKGGGTYGVAAGRMESVTLIFEGTFTGYPPYNKPVETAALAEWRRADE
ncbi:MAG TPA: hypothetical protein VMN36_10160 [Verrucomicrobiales bacterium]|nr:hypothetical protein [Verrucomicrobiales bacterium]